MTKAEVLRRVAGAAADGPLSGARTVLPSASATTTLRPATRVGRGTPGGFWAERSRINRDVSLLVAYDELERAGNLAYFRAVIAGGDRVVETAAALNDQYVYNIFDSDVYKWLEAVGYEAAYVLDPDLAARSDDVIGLIERAQRPDGYLHTAIQNGVGREPLHEWRLGHELYCGGHLLQAGIAWHRSVGDDRLLGVARRFTDWLLTELDNFDPKILPLHPGLEMALVELFRVTDDRRYLELAATFLNRRGHGNIGYYNFSPEYFLDERPVRQSEAIRGHAVMALFLLCGVVDVAVETGDASLLAVAERQWTDMVQHKTYLTGGVGSRHHGESFGDAYELSPDRAYCETCAAVGSVMLSWRLLLATGEAKYADLIERVLYNAVLPGVSLDGRRFFYVNPLQVREADQVVGIEGCHIRTPWFECACCPPNAMRILSTVEEFLATGSSEGVQIHQLISGSACFAAAGSERTVRVDSALPFGEQVTVTVTDAGDEAEWTLALRVPSWSLTSRVQLIMDGSATTDLTPGQDGYVHITRVWAAGDAVRLAVDNTVVMVEADPRIDACVGHLAIARGPLVYCVEEVDLHATRLENIRVDARGPWTAEPAAALDGIVSLVGKGSSVTPDPGDGLPYRAARGSSPVVQPLRITAVPYFAWNNRGPTAMKVWLPIERAV
jgi:uncharacterized protein